MFLRLYYQSDHLVDGGDTGRDFPTELYSQANARINPHISTANLRPGRLSPLGSASLGAVLLRIAIGSSQFEGHRVHHRDVRSLQSAVEVALEQGKSLGGDEPLYGRVGLLWAILNIRRLGFDSDTRTALSPLFESIPPLVEAIVETGILGAQSYTTSHGVDFSLPLMWPWHDKDYVGA